MKVILLLVVALSIRAVADDRIVLAEYSTNSSCIPCVAATNTLNSDLSQTGRAHIAVIQYHTPNPSTSDPFYQSNKTEADARASAYGIQSNPQFFLDGTSAGGNSANWETAMNFEMTKTATVSISLSGNFSGTTGTVNIHFSQSAPAGTKLFAVITETGLEFTGANGEDVHNDVFRTTLGAGWTGNDPATTTSLPFSLGVDTLREPGIAHPWNPDSCRIIVWLQNPSTKAVTQAAQIWLNDLVTDVRETGVPAESELQLSPNPSHGTVSLSMNDKSSAQLSIVDLLGRTLYVARGSSIPLTLNMNTFPAGVYRVVVSRNGVVTSSQSLVRN